MKKPFAKDIQQSGALARLPVMSEILAQWVDETFPIIFDSPFKKLTLFHTARNWSPFHHYRAPSVPELDFLYFEEHLMRVIL